MKRVDLIRAIEKMGCILIRHGGKHDWYQNPLTRASQPIPRHREIKDSLALHISELLPSPNLKRLWSGLLERPALRLQSESLSAHIIIRNPLTVYACWPYGQQRLNSRLMGIIQPTGFMPVMNLL